MNRAIAFIGAMALLLGGCTSGGDQASPERSSSVEAESSRPTVTAAPVDPLEGEWRQTYTCEDAVRTWVVNMHLISPRSRRGMAETTGLSTALPGLIDYYIREIAWGPNAATATQLTPNALCTGAGKRTTIMRFDDGRAVSFRASSTDTGPVMVYEFLDDHTLTMNDGNQNLEGTLTVTFRIEGDNLSFDQGSERADQDPWGGTQLEVAPFVRVN